MRLKDSDVRVCLRQEIKEHFAYDLTTHIVDELQICNGVARVDIAAINGALHGYEIKSESDTLIRLPNQLVQYNKVFDYVYLVCADNQIEEAYKLIPNWWGIYLVSNCEGMARLTIERKPSPNCNLDPFSLLQFLNKEELVRFGLMFDVGTEPKLQRTQKYRLWQIISAKVDACEIPLFSLAEFLRTTLKTREGGRTHLLQT